VASDLRISTSQISFDTSMTQGIGLSSLLLHDVSFFLESRIDPARTRPAERPVTRDTTSRMALAFITRL